MKIKALLLCLLAASVLAFAQGPGRGRGAGMGPGAGQGRGPMGDCVGAGPCAQGQGDMGTAQRVRSLHRQRLNEQTEKAASFRMLQEKTGMSAPELKNLYERSGVRNYGQFAAALLVSKNLNLDREKVLENMKTQSLGRSLSTLGIDRQTAQNEMRKARQELWQADSSLQTQ